MDAIMEMVFENIESFLPILVLLGLVTIIILIRSAPSKSPKVNTLPSAPKQAIPEAVKEPPYKLKTQFLTRREASFYEFLFPISSKYQLIIFAKPRIADFVSVTAQKYVKGSGHMTYFNKISAKHIDFLLCDNNFTPVLGFEVDDSTHNNQKTKERDAFVDEVYKDIELLSHPARKQSIKK